ncbi:hypothetical protein V6N13_039853 [Hibiscus sabdariffa]
MEVCRTLRLKSDDKLKHRPLTPYRFFRGLKSNVLLLWPMAIDVVFSGDDVPQKERVLVVVNHRTEVDRIEEKCVKSHEFAAKVGLPVLPKTRGFCLCLRTLGNSLDAEAGAWLIDRFKVKDRLLRDFESQGP